MKKDMPQSQYPRERSHLNIETPTVWWRTRTKSEITYNTNHSPPYAIHYANTIN